MLAAGMGRRLGEYTKNNTKCMLPVNGVRLIDRVINMLVKRNFNRLVMVVGYKGQNVIDYIGNKYKGKIQIDFINNDIFDRTNNIYSLALAKEELCKDDTILLESDLIFDEEMLDLLLKHPNPNLALVAKYESWMDGTMVTIDEERNIVNFVPKEAFRFDATETYYKTVNIYKFSKDFSSNYYVPFLEAYSKVMGLNEYYEQVLRILLHLHNIPLKALPITTEKWYEIDDKQDLDIAEAIFADENHLLKKYYGRYGGFWRFPQMLDFCYLVNPYFLRSKIVDEVEANFRTLLSEYPSGMRVNTLLASKCWGVNENYIMPGNGAAELIKVLTEKLTGSFGIIRPTFEEYPNRLSIDRVKVFVPAKEDFRYDVDDIISHFENVEICNLLLINPDNPSGNYIPIDEVLRLTKWCSDKGIKLVLDESFVDFTDNWRNASCLSDDILEANPNLIVIKSISKSYGVPGLRLGILASADINLLCDLKKNVSIWNINSFAEFFMQIFTKYEKDYFKACDQFLETRRDFLKALNTIPFFHVMETQANFVFVEVLSPYKPSEIVLKMLRDFKILMSACNAKKGIEPNRYMRIAIRNHSDNDKLIEALKTLK